MKLIIFKLLLFIPIVLIIASVSVFQDPAHIFNRGKYEKGIVRLLQTNINAAGISNYDERLLQMYYIESLEQPKQCLVLGSSRIMQLRPGTETSTNSFYNAAVSGASLEDLIGIYELFRQHSKLPGYLIIGLDPWLLNKNNEQVRWKTLIKPYHSFLKRVGKPLPAIGIKDRLRPYKEYLEAFSPNYFQSALKDLYYGKNRFYRPTKETTPDELTKLSNGSIVYDKNTRNLSLAEIKEKAIAYASQNPVYSLGNYKELDPELQNLFKTFIDAIINDGVSLSFFLAPYHPDAYRIMISSGKYGMVPQSELFFLEVARKKRIPVFGSFDPETVDIGKNDFYDGMHPREQASMALLKRTTNNVGSAKQ